MNQINCSPPLPATPFSFSILVDSPIRRDLPFCPVSAVILPLAKMNLQYASLIIAALDFFMTFLFKRCLVHPPTPGRIPPEHYPLTLTMPQLSQIMNAALNGQIPMSSPIPGQGFGPVGGDEPLFPDNLSVSLIISAPFAPFDGSPDTSFNVPLFEIPGAPGNLIIAFGLITAQFLIERAGVGTPNGSNGTSNGSSNGSPINNAKGGIANGSALSSA